MADKHEHTPGMKMPEKNPAQAKGSVALTQSPQ